MQEGVLYILAFSWAPSERRVGKSSTWVRRTVHDPTTRLVCNGKEVRICRESRGIFTERTPWNSTSMSLEGPGVEPMHDLAAVLLRRGWLWDPSSVYTTSEARR